MTLYTMADVVCKTGIPYWRLYYAEYAGTLPVPMRVGRNRIYTEQDVERIKGHFANKEDRHEDALRTV